MMSNIPFYVLERRDKNVQTYENLPIQGGCWIFRIQGEDLTRVSKLKYKESLYNNGNIIKHQSEYILMNNMLMNNILSNDIY